MNYEAWLPLFFKGSERLCIVAAATLCIVLGYKLFKIVPSQKESEGKFTFGDISANLSKVGPGIFFALFGAFVLYQSVESVLQMEIYQTNKNGGHTKGQDVDSKLKINWMGAVDPKPSDWVIRASAPIKILNCLAKKAKGKQVERDRIDSAVHSAKVAIIADVWLPEWGDSEAFARLNMGDIEKKSPIGELYYAMDEDC